jgi:hypothetical protein
MARREHALLALSIGLLAGAALGYQVLLFRLLAIVQWSPFVATIVSLALLGHGAAGTALALGGRRLLPHFPQAFATSAALFAVTAPLCWALAQRLPFNGLELVWNPAQMGWLVALFLILALPFFFAACCFGLAFMHVRERIPILYAADLLGAGVGAGLATGLLFVIPAEEALRVVAVTGAIAAGLPATPRLLRLALPALAVAVALLLPADALVPRITPYKGLPRTLAIMGAEVVEERSSPFGLLTVVRNEAIPFRHAPGRSLTGTSELPHQLAVFTDGDGMTALTPGADRASLAWLGETTSALPYRMTSRPRVLVLGAGGGTEVLQALYHDARGVDAVELNPDMRSLARDWLGESRVRWHLGDARGFVRADGRQYDLVQIALLDSPGGSGAGVQALAESYVYTVEALADYYERLAPGGWLAMTRWEKQPPRDGLKLFAMAVEMLRELGVDPGGGRARISCWPTSTQGGAPRPITAADVGRIRAFCAERGFDPAWFPGIHADEVNRHHRVPQPWLHEGAVALLGDDGDAFFADYRFNVGPATDERPFFFNFFRWSLLPELQELRGQGGLTLLDTGYLVLAATLALAVPVSLLLILAPLAALGQPAGATGRARPACYFLCLGLAFLFVEIACMQRYGLFIGHPLFAAVAVLIGFLVFAGAGSLAATRLRGRPHAVSWAVAGIVLLLALQMFALPPSLGIVESTGARIAVALAILAPLAFLMGIPFPLGLSRLAGQMPAFIPWAWGINGCASVLSALLAALLAVHFGFSVVLLVSAALYTAAVLAWPARPERKPLIGKASYHSIP